jgi:hypothetical protein
MFIGGHKMAIISSTCLFLWVHVYVSRMGSNGFVIALLWLLWITYTILILTATIPESNDKLECYAFFLGYVYFFVLIGWVFMNLTPEGEKNPDVSRDMADIYVVLCAVITCSAWAYFS